MKNIKIFSSISILLLLACACKKENFAKINVEEKAKFETNNGVLFSIITDSNFEYEDDFILEHLKENCLIANINKNDIAKFHSYKGDILNIVSVEDNFIELSYKRNNAFRDIHVPHSETGKIFLFYKDGKFINLLKYPDFKRTQGGCSFKLLETYKKNNELTLVYDYQMDDVREIGFGTVKFVFEKLKSGTYYLQDYDFDVQGHFSKGISYHNKNDILGEETFIPDIDGDIILERKISKTELVRQFYENLKDVFYDSVELETILIVSENLNLRDNPKYSATIKQVLKENMLVKILEIGAQEIIDGIPSKWCYVQVMERDQSNKNILNETAIKGWCFGAYLK